MKKTKLKKGDIVVFELFKELQIGYVTEPVFHKAMVKIGNNVTCYFKQEDFTKIGTMPNDWL